ncbi:ABC transporter permease [Fulvivirgaceae bacterium BMA10]|uniref:ABC transporter permease n=1 Tax=Splendidivirga corallicola TaxID=3051826 RepID=A0ABT8KYR6_9BACT|nr:ABC transporter permease [Fulvivirgaceae bacterium BMA10]
MFKNYLTIAFRNILKHKTYSIINISGLAVGIAATIVIVLFAHNELTYDEFHENSEDTYLVYKERITPNGVQPTYDTWVPLLEQMQLDFPEVINGSRLVTGNASVNIHGKRFDDPCTYVDPEFFEVFTFPLVLGNNDNPLPDNNSIVISQELARKYFGQENPIGKELLVDFELNYKVTGVLANVPKNSSIELDLVLPIRSIPQYSDVEKNWNGSFLSTYIQLSENASAAGLEAKFPDFIVKIWDKETQQRTNFKLLPLLESYSTFIGDEKDSYILLYIALGIIIIACINFMNLATARSMERAKEIGMRKVMGAVKKQLIFQFLSEATIMSLMALILGILITEVAVPKVNGLFDLELNLPYFTEPVVLLILLVFGLLVGLMAGSYPAFYLSGFRILESIKGIFLQKLGGAGIRNILVIVQFAMSITLIVATIIIDKQLRFMKNADLSFNKENLLVVPVSQRDFPNDEETRTKLETFRNEITNHSAIIESSTSTHIPGRWSRSNVFVRPEGWEGDPMRMRYTYHDAGFFETYGIKLLDGPGFLPDAEGNQRESVVLNQAALKAFGWDDPNEKAIVIGDRKINVVGVIQDFHYETLRTEIQPILHFHRIPANAIHNYISLRINQSDFNHVRSFIEDKWQVLDPSQSFEYFFMDENLNQMYESEDRMLKMVTTFSSISIIIACLGLFGLSSFIIEKRRKEIGIRKVLGASVTKLAFSLCNSFTKLILIAFLVAVPVSYYSMNLWLSDFASRIDIGLGVFAATILMATIIAWITIAYKSIRAAVANPVEALRDE